MKQVLISAALMEPTVAQAHPGFHRGFAPGALLTPIAGQPDHVAMVIGVLAVAAALSWRLWSRT